MIYSFIILIFHLSFEKEEQKCPTYKETTLEPKECLYKQSPLSILLHKCNKNSKCIIDKEIKEGICNKNEKEYDKLSYPGGKCEKDSDCLSDICTNNICEGKKSGEDCIDNSECYFGLSCLNNFCKVPKPKFTECSNTDECKYPLKCFKGKCIELFSIDNGIEVDEENAFLCKSGRVYLGKCNSLKNNNLNCESDNKCFYSNNNGETFEINDLCNCEFSFGNDLNIGKKCLNGDIDNDNWNKVIKIMKKTLLPNNTKYCNNEEKIGSYCREILRNNWNARIEQIYLDKYLIESKYSSILPQNPVEKELIMKTIYSFDDTPPIQKEFKCPKINLGEITFDNNTCAYGENPFNENGDNIQVYVNPKPCEYGYICNFDEKKLKNNWSYNSTCEYKFGANNNYQNYLKFPGEKCTSDNICMRGNYNDIGECKDGICTGHFEEEICKSNSDCNLGLFCNETIGICKKLKNKGEYCTNQYECKNNLGCMNNTCVEYYSLQAGSYVEKKGIKDFKVLCKFGEVDERSGKCLDELKYYNVKPENIDSNGFVKCEINEICNYTSGDDLNEIYTKKCECGFNKNGTSYCPLSHEYNKDSWIKYFDIKKKYYSDECHTLKRFDCVNYDNFNLISMYKRETIEAHKFYGAEKGVIATLKGFNLKLNYYLLLVLFYVII